MQLDLVTGEETQLTRLGGHNGGVSHSPDGNWIAFSAGIEHDGRGTFDLWLMRPDGSRRQVPNKTGNTEAWHEWRPGEHFCR